MSQNDFPDKRDEDEDDFIIRLANECGFTAPTVTRWKDGIDVEYVAEPMKRFVRRLRDIPSATLDRNAGGNDSPWPAVDVVRKLADAADILLAQYDYDGHGWEEIRAASDVARRWLTASPPSSERDSELEAYKSILGSAFCVVLNANDFYGYSCADATQIEEPGFKALVRLAKEYGGDGINAAMAIARNCDPLKELQTTKFKAAIASVTDEERKDLAEPDFCSDWAELNERLRAMEAKLAASATLESAAVQELRNMVNAKRFDRDVFEDDTAFVDWALNRCRHALDSIDSGAKE